MRADKLDIISKLCKNLYREINDLSEKEKIYPIEFLTFITAYNLLYVYAFRYAKLKEKWVEEKFIKCLRKLAVPEDTLSIWTGLGAVLYIMDIVGKKWANTYVDEIQKQLIKKVNEHIRTLDFSNLELSQIDFTHGISGILFLAAEIEYVLSEDIGINLLHTIRSLIESGELEKIYVENEEMIQGFSHGEIGIYLSCLLYANSIYASNWKEYYAERLVKALENRFKSSKEKDINQLTNTWCHGYIGFCRAYRIAESKGLICSEILKRHVLDYLNKLKGLNFENICFSSILCHGLSGIVYEISQDSHCFGEKSTLEYFEKALIELANDTEVNLYSDHEVSIKQNNGVIYTDIILGYQGVLLTLCSITYKKRFKGSFLLGG